MTEKKCARRIIGHMVVRNEADRYLSESLAWLSRHTDAMYVYDDRSTDRTAPLAMQAGAMVRTRTQLTPSFAEDESAFRQAGWEWMTERARLTEDDWVLCIDADEFLVATDADEARSVRQLLEQSADQGMTVTFPVAEIFATFDVLERRIDGYWKAITADRFARWVPDPAFMERCEGGGSLPRAARFARPGISTALTILHFGYARPDDRQAKYQRYSKGRGHNLTHVGSIIRPPQLEPWTGQNPWES